MKNIEKYIPIALNVLKERDTNIVVNGEINSTYNGYISSFGASMITSGLLPTFIFYSKKATGSNKVDRSLIVKAIEKMIKKLDPSLLPPNGSILEKILEAAEAGYSDKRLKQIITECAIALKLAIRTYPQT